MADRTQAVGPVEVVILGAGVIGLTVAYTLLTSSPNAYKSLGGRELVADQKLRKENSEMGTSNVMWGLIPQGLAMELPSRVFFTTSEDLSQLWYKDLVRDFRIMNPSEVPAGLQGGITFKTFSINPELYLPWLQSELLARGVEFIRKRVHSLDEAAALAGTNGVLVNATGLGARSLIGVEDADVYPIRGQTIIAHAPGLKEFVSLPLGAGKPGEATYIIPRPSPPGEVLLGGTFQPDNWDTSLDVATARGILERCMAFMPQLKQEEIRVLRHNVGLRPARRGGPRVEAEWADLPLKSELRLLLPSDNVHAYRVLLVHAYGFGAAGYQNSWGAAQEVADLIADKLH